MIIVVQVVAAFGLVYLLPFLLPAPGDLEVIVGNS